jgi:hypothetical protein
MAEIRDLPVMDISQQAFAPYGAFIPPMEDGTAFGPQDAALQLGAGIPRFYTMRLPNRGLMISRITRHRKVTQVLGSAGGLAWLLAVAPPPPRIWPARNRRCRMFEHSASPATPRHAQYRQRAELQPRWRRHQSADHAEDLRPNLAARKVAALI